MPITDIFVQPDIRRHRITVTVHALESADVSASIEGLSPTVEARANEPFVVEFPEYTLWQPGASRFYELTTELLVDGKVDDRRVTPFAMREVTVKDHRFVVNNRPQFLRAVRAAEHAKSDTLDELLFERLLENGFNAMWVRADRASANVLDMADRAGMFLFIALDDAHALEYVRSNRNRACIAGWTLEGAVIDTKAMHEVDPTRLIVDLQHKPARYSRPYRADPQTMEYVQVAIDYPPSRAAENLLRNSGQPALLSLIEAAWMPGQSDALLDSGLGDAETIRRRRLTSLAVRELRANTNVAGFILPLNLVHEDDAADLKADHAEVMPVIQMHRTNLVPRQEAPITVTLVNEARLEGRADLSLQVVGPTNQVLWKKKRNVKIPRHGRELWSGTVAASGSTGRHRVVVRLQSAGSIVAEASHPFDVFKPLEKTDQHVDIVGEAANTVESLETIGFHLTPAAPVVLVPRLANTIRAYPDNELAQALGRAYSGAVAIVIAPPSDWNEFAEFVSPALAIDVHDLDPTRETAFRSARLHPVFDNLPTRMIMGREYAGVIGPAIGIGDSEEDISVGKLVHADRTVVDASDIVVRRYGSGRVVFVFLDPVDVLGQDPLADRLVDNLVRHFARRSLPSEGAFPAHQRAVEWLRDQRARRIRRWHLIGPFGNSGGLGHSESYPPESGTDFTATYPGWFAAVFWKPHYAIAGETVDLPFDEACRNHHRAVSTGDSGTYYAYSEIASDQRVRARIRIDSPHATACWFNRAEVIRSPQPESLAESVTHEATVSLRQGRNSILVKCSKTFGLAHARVTLTPLDDPVTLRWWN